MERVTHEHMGVSGAVNDKYLEYDKLYRSGKGDWAQCKSFYRESLEDKKALANLQAANNFSNLTPNNKTTKSKSTLSTTLCKMMSRPCLVKAR